MFTSIASRVVIVTGGSRGIGRGIARAFAANGARVLIAARDEAKAQTTCDEITVSGGTAALVVADVGRSGDAEKIVQAAIDKFGGIDILCANAGIFPAARLREMTEADIDTMFDTNLKGSILMVKACIPALERSGHGRVILTSSITGPITGLPGFSHYGASKAGQLGFMRTAAMELADARITVNAVVPGNIHTEALEALGDDYIRQMEGSIPLRRLGTVDDIANTALFLATDEAGFITGQTIVVDGGQVLPESLMALQENLSPSAGDGDSPSPAA